MMLPCSCRWCRAEKRKWGKSPHFRRGRLQKPTFSCCPPRKSSVASRDATLHKQIEWFGCTSWYASHSAIWVILKLPPTCMWHDCWNQSGLWRWSQGCPEYTRKRTEEKVKKRRIKVRGSPYATSAAWLSGEDVAELQPEPSHAVFYPQSTWQTN